MDNFVKHGTGVFTYSNGDIYDGQYQNDVKSGTGAYKYFASGNRYTGKWKNNKKHGKGIFLRADGERYDEGVWEDDVLLT